jgi:UDP-GlcNAc:undecaprenyl-phosphate GlcNAc-1-phosphate transferase
MGSGDKTHLHHKLLDLGLSHPQIAILQYFAYTIIGFIALAVSGLYLTIAVIGTVLIVVLIFVVIYRLRDNYVRLKR